MFTFERWKQLTNLTSVQLRLSGVQARSSLEIGEWYRVPLGNILRKIRFLHLSICENLFLNIAVEQMNDAMGRNGIVPARLVFGIITKLLTINTNLPIHKIRMKATKTAQAKLNPIVAGCQI